MEAVGVGLGAASLLIGFKSAIDGLALLSAIYHSFEDASFFAAKLKIEGARLQVWGQFFGFDDDRECQKLLSQAEATQSLVLYILKEFEDATTNLDRMSTKYGIRLAGTDVRITPGAHTKLKPKSDLLDSLAEKQAEYNKRLKWWKKGWSWVLEEPKFEKLLDRLEYLNDSLEKIVPRVDLGLLGQGLVSFLSPTHGPTYLDAFRESSQQYLLMSAAAKKLKLDSRLAEKVPTVQLDHMSNLSGLEEGTGRRPSSALVHGFYQDQGQPSTMKGILVEWKEPNPDLTLEEANEVLSRIKRLCLLFSKVSNGGHDSAFRVLPCLGLVEDTAYQTPPGSAASRKKYGFVLECPLTGSKPESLYHSYTSLVNVPVGDRFRLAQNLASGLLLLHSSKWLHKDVRSHHVILFRSHQGDKHETRHLASPYLTGFAYARPDAPGEKSMERPRAARGQRVIDFYRHPDFSQGHTRRNDIYGLGVVLFEIGHWQSIEAMCEAHGLHFGVEADVRSFLVENCQRGRRPRARMGDVYASVVLRCLEGDFGPSASPGGSDSDRELVKAFWSSVVRELDSCQA